MDESTLRIYFRRVLAVPSGASRKVLRSARDKRAAQWREKMLAASGADKQAFEKRLAITNMAYDALSDSVRFRAYYTRLEAGEETLPELESLLEGLGESTPRPLPQRVLEKRQTAVHERMQRARTLIEGAVKQGAESEAKSLQANRIPDSDEFYDAVYAAAVAGGRRAKEEELATVTRSAAPLDDDCLAELDVLITDTAEIAAHRAYDKLEDSVASVEQTRPSSRGVALALSLVILGLVFGAAYWGMSRNPEAFLSNSARTSTTGLTAADAVACENSIDKSVQAAANARIASGGGLISTAGPAGLGGSANEVKEDGQVSYHEGIQAAISGDTVRALACFEEAYRLSPKLKLALYNKGSLQALSGQPKEAIASFNEALTAYPNLAQLYYNRGLAHQNLASRAVARNDASSRLEAGIELQQAINNYTATLRINERCAQAYYNRGFANYCLAHFDKAYEDFEKAAKLLPAADAAIYNKTVVATLLKRPVAALAKAPPTAPIGPVGPAWIQL